MPINANNQWFKIIIIIIIIIIITTTTTTIFISTSVHAGATIQ